MRSYLVFSLCFLFWFGCNNATGIKSEKNSTQIKDITLEEAYQFAKENDNYIWLDVRTPQEIAQGKIIANAMELDYYQNDFRKEINKLDKDVTYLVYCKSGNRSNKAKKMMAEDGFKNVYNIMGGYMAWKENNK